MKKKIYYHDTDCGGIVYYGNYLKYLEEARTSLFEDHGISVSELADNNVLFVVARVEIDYKSSAHYADEIDIKTWVTDIGKVKVWFEYEIKDQHGVLLTKAKTLMICVDRNIKTKAIPPEVLEKLEKMKVTGQTNA